MAERIVLQGNEAHLTGGDGADVRAKISALVESVNQASVKGLDPEPLADNVKWKISAGPLTVCIVELEHALRRMMWLAEDSPAPYGPAATYRERRLATPYVVLKIPFLKGRIVNRAELFYRNEPLGHITDPVYWSNLLNVSPNSYGCAAWCCTQYLAHERPGTGITKGLDALVKHLFGGGWNRSSEASEGSSAFSKAKKDGVDPRVTDVDRWEAESVRDPRFVLSVQWKPVGLTVLQLLEAELKYHGVRNPDSATELANLLLSSRNGRKGGP